VELSVVGWRAAGSASPVRVRACTPGDHHNVSFASDPKFMLHCSMGCATSPPLGLEFDDVLGSLQYARRIGDLGRLAHLTYWDVRKWARWTQRDALAERAADLVKGQPLPSRSAFLAIVDDVIAELERIRAEAGDGDTVVCRTRA
jgi:hypothetical protein